MGRDGWRTAQVWLVVDGMRKGKVGEGGVRGTDTDNMEKPRAIQEWTSEWSQRRLKVGSYVQMLLFVFGLFRQSKGWSIQTTK